MLQSLEEQEGVRGEAILLYGDVIHSGGKKFRQQLKNHAFQALVPLLLHLADSCPDVVMKTKFTFLRCALLLKWEFRKELFGKLAWGRGLGAENDIFIYMVRCRPSWRRRGEAGKVEPGCVQTPPQGKGHPGGRRRRGSFGCHLIWPRGCLLSAGSARGRGGRRCRSVSGLRPPGWTMCGPTPAVLWTSRRPPPPSGPAPTSCRGVSGPGAR
ncbi:uncharacterized protein LOC125128642 [Phacochoerus africanus]|uniref:uncharacterized protein LOC125128642 n=1 Tax=Phacochoerus africanus TaxID=41426 RepID=UPI001FD8E23D|nr:uncharacterized protein LOC125128642 [Phacochoerus africanus]